MKLVKCLKCGWVYMARDRDICQAEVDSFNHHFYKLDKAKQEEYYNGKCSRIENYETCFRCDNNYKNFTDAKDEDCPTGSTINGIIDRED